MGRVSVHVGVLHFFAAPWVGHTIPGRHILPTEVIVLFTKAISTSGKNGFTNIGTITLFCSLPYDEHFHRKLYLAKRLRKSSLFSSWITIHSSGVEGSPLIVPPVVHSSKHSPQLVVQYELVGSPGSIIIALPAAVYFDLVQKSGGFGSLPQPHAPLVRSLYQVVEAHGFPLNIGGQPSQYDNFGVSGCWQEDSAKALAMTVKKKKIMAVFMTTKQSYRLQSIKSSEIC